MTYPLHAVSLPVYKGYKLDAYKYYNITAV